MKGKDLKCPTCGAGAVDVAPDFDLSPGLLAVMCSTQWTCSAGHTNMIDVAQTSEGEEYIANEETIP